jgi:glutathione synthase/RimK-type ligase-like ATP-grasp enzyme
MAASEEFLPLDDNWPLLRRALTEQGMDATVHVWNDPAVDWGRFALVLVLYVWGYPVQRRSFLDWAGQVDSRTRLVNSLAAVTWSSDKTYLRDLEDAGVRVIPTTWIEAGTPWHPPAGDYVIKPSVASGGLGAARYAQSAVAVADDHVRRLHAQGQTVMVQPYQAAVDASGETALVFIGGQFSHAVGKQALLRPDVGETDRLWAHEVITAVQPRRAQRELAETALTAAGARVGPVAYARVDVVDDADGRPQVLEVELIEPTLSLTVEPAAAGRLARTLGRLIG